MGLALSKRIKKPIIVRDDYVIYLEYFEEALWFHTDITRWTSKIKKQFLKDLKVIMTSVSLPVKALVTEDNKKLAKFGRVTNWEIEKQVVLNNGNTAYIYSWSK